jgi:hypothetical protein
MLESDYNIFKAMIMLASPDFQCNSSINNGEYCFSTVHTCDYYWENMETLTIELNYDEYIIQPQGYTLSNDLDGYPCGVSVSYSPDKEGLYILGDTFLRNFVTSFDYKKN